jgi:hypothetical protein
VLYIGPCYLDLIVKDKIRRPMLKRKAANKVICAAAIMLVKFSIVFVLLVI